MKKVARLTFCLGIKDIIMRNKKQLKISDVAVLESDDHDKNILYENNIMDKSFISFLNILFFNDFNKF